MNETIHVQLYIWISELFGKHSKLWKRRQIVSTALYYKNVSNHLEDANLYDNAADGNHGFRRSSALINEGHVVVQCTTLTTMPSVYTATCF